MVDKINELIQSLSEDLKEQKPMAHPALRLLPWVLLVFALVGFAVFKIGIRADIQERLYDSVFLYEMLSAGFIALSAAVAALWLSVPDMRGQKWIVAVPLTLCLHFALWLLVKAWPDDIVWPSMHVYHCAMEGPGLSFFPALALMLITHRGATTHPYLMALMNIIAAGAVGYIGARLICSMDQVGHDFVYHIMPFVALGIVVGALARRIFKW